VRKAALNLRRTCLTSRRSRPSRYREMCMQPSIKFLHTPIIFMIVPLLYLFLRRDNAIEDDGVRALVGSLKALTSLTSLDLR
jgi:hypothetical protein